MCQEACEYQRRYSPGLNTLRYCSHEGCQKWFHVGCTKRLEQPITMQMMPECIYSELHDENARETHPLFSKLLCSPIQRAPPHGWTNHPKDTGDYPFSFEVAILTARKTWLEGQAPVNPEQDQAWMLSVMGIPMEDMKSYNDTAQEALRRIRQFSCLPIPRYHVCPTCGSII